MIKNILHKLFSKKRSCTQLTSNRYDLTAKLLYIKRKDQGINSDFFKKLYLHHIKVWNGFYEKGKFTGEEKHSKQEFLDSFDRIIESIKVNGFDASKSKIWVDKDGNLLNGAHRLAACLYFNEDFETEVHPRAHGQLIANYKYFLNKKDKVKTGLKREYTDIMALEYVNLKKSTFGVTIFPAAKGNDEKVEKLIKKYASIVYKKEISLTQNGAFNLIKIFYRGEKWIGAWNNDFEGAWGKVKPCFPQKSKEKLRFYVIDTNQPEKLPPLKAKIRKVYGIKNHSIHINDTHQETLEISQSLLNDNSIHFLNHSKLTKVHSTFLRYFKEYKKQIKRKKIDPDKVMIVSSGVLAAYGLRDVNDIDFLGKEDSSIKSVSKSLQLHNSQIKYYSDNPDELIYNPNNHFYFRGIKFQMIDNLMAMKQKRGEKKDLEDIKLMKSIKQLSE